jgi:branched-chain amino acid transport system ATP-binding protein
LTDPLLSTSKLNAFYGSFQALFDLDISVGKGECIALVGSNGAGKSTLLRSLSGLISVKPESVQFSGQAIGGIPAEDVVQRGLALVPEGRKLFPSLTVEENLLMGASAKRPGPWTLNKVYEFFPNIAERKSNLATALSGGQQQMVAIGRALMSNPILLLCDEISLGLAPIVVRELYARLKDIRQSGTSFIVVEQDISQAMAVADRLYCLRAGRISLEGKPTLLSRHAITEAYFGLEQAHDRH